MDSNLLHKLGFDFANLANRENLASPTLCENLSSAQYGAYLYLNMVVYKNMEWTTKHVIIH